MNSHIGNRSIYAILNSNEQSMTFSIGDLQFIDIFQVTASSLDLLVSNLYDKEDKFNNVTHMKGKFPEQMDMLCRKGLYNYEVVDVISKLDLVGLPPKEAALLIMEERRSLK